MESISPLRLPFAVLAAELTLQDAGCLWLQEKPLASEAVGCGPGSLFSAAALCGAGYWQLC